MTFMHPEEVKLTGYRKAASVADLAADIQNVGLICPPLVGRNQRTREWVLLAGERRWAAVVSVLGRSRVKVRLATTWDDLLEWLHDDDQPGRTRVPMTYSEAVRWTAPIIAILRPKRTDKPERVLAEAIGFKYDAFRQAKYLINIVEAIGTPRPVRLLARELLTEVDANRLSPWSALDQVTVAERKANGEPDVPERDPRPRSGQPAPPLPEQSLTAAQQRTILTNATTSLSGISDALASLGRISADLDAAERLRYRQGLAGARLQLVRTIKALGAGVSE